MKKYLLYLILVFVLTLGSCKKDGESSASTKLEGRWKKKSFEHEHYIDGKLQPPSGTITTTIDYIIFEGKNYTGYNSDGEVEEVGTYTLVGNKLSITSHDLTISLTIKWINDNEFSYTNRFDISIPKNEYYINTTTYIRHK